MNQNMFMSKSPFLLAFSSYHRHETVQNSYHIHCSLYHVNVVVRCTAEKMLDQYMPFLVKNWPFIVAIAACVVAARYLMTVISEQALEKTNYSNEGN